MANLETRHKVFVSFHHKLDEKWKIKFADKFSSILIPKWVNNNEINSELSTDYIKRIIQEDYISSSTITVVLIGNETYLRKHVDWEISASISSKVGGRSGLLGLILPSRKDYSTKKYEPNTIPQRLYDNVKTEYAKIYNWTDKIEDMQIILQEAFDRKNNKTLNTDNSLIQYKNNRRKQN